MGCEKIDLPGGGFAIVCSGESRATPRPEKVSISGRVLYLGDKAVKFWTPIADVPIPYSQILAKEPAGLKEGDEARLTMPLWLARKKGLVEPNEQSSPACREQR